MKQTSPGYLKQLKAISWWEFKRFFKWKQELFSIVLLVGIFAVSAGWGAITQIFSEEYEGAIFYEQGQPQGFEFDAPKALNIRSAGTMEVENWKTQLPEELDTLIVITPELTAKVWVKKSQTWQQELRTELQEQLQDLRIQQLPLAPEEKAVIDEKPEIAFSIEESEDASIDDTSDGSAGMLLAVIMVGVFTGFGLMMMSITAEKQQRVTEQLLTIVTPTQWMDGKIIGITLHSLKAMLFIGLMILGVSLVVAAFSDKSGSGLDWGIGTALLSLIFVLLGTVLINALLAGFSATIDDPNHSSRSTVMLVPLLPVFLGFSVIGAPDSTLATVMSILPVSSFAMMPARLLQTDVAVWEWLLSLALLLVFVYWMRNVAGRLFAMGIQYYGKEPGWKEIWRAVSGK
ncbi:ABC transporter permease [Idiomarina sp. PL1-037]|uniref:ABC transporter permease n=1 Tax=Idiomarina TaxID=135575 RepID=UPI00294B33A0|nr:MULTISPECIES: ABC transporter permease [unclassified Idiomarina]MDV6328297.1 ABC transporter permease [Idiomarina sp. Sol25]WQC53264.1 ABC transporter permease [Idiomarina sp. PL1-037]